MPPRGPGESDAEEGDAKGSVTSTPVRHRHLQVNGLRLHMLEFHGREAVDIPLVCLHGVTNHAWFWHDVAARLADGRRVIALDLRGHGDSQWSGKQQYATTDHVEDVSAVLDALGLTTVDMAGLSWGGLVALGLAARRPEATRALVMVDVPASFDQDETDVPPQPRAFANHREVVDREGLAYPRAPTRLARLIACHGTRPSTDGELVRKHDPYFRSRWPFRSDDAWEELRRVRVPLQVVRAAASDVLTRDVAERMAVAASTARLSEIADCGHLVPVERPASLADAMAAFFDDVRVDELRARS